MRLHSPASLGLAAAALLAAAPPAHAEPPAALPSCVTGDGAFPLTTRLHGGPASYAAGGGFGTWYLDLTNKTTRTCTDIHPVVVLVDGKRALEPSQPRLEFYDGRSGTPPHPVRFETTDQDELVGAFDGFPGFTVGPRKTITVKIRLAVTSDAVPNRITANAAVVQRHDGDGDWVGQSNDYRFTIEADPTDAAHPPGTAAPTDPAGRDASAQPDASPTPGSDAARNRLSLADELARTGLTSPPGVTFAATLALLLTGAGLLVVWRRR